MGNHTWQLAFIAISSDLINICITNIHQLLRLSSPAQPEENNNKFCKRAKFPPILESWVCTVIAVSRFEGSTGPGARYAHSLRLHH